MMTSNELSKRFEDLVMSVANVCPHHGYDHIRSVVSILFSRNYNLTDSQAQECYQRVLMAEYDTINEFLDRAKGSP